MIGALEQYYYRNVIAVTLFSVIVNAAPHGATVRATYTVPANKNACVMPGSLGISVAAAPGAGLADVYCDVSTGQIMGYVSIDCGSPLASARDQSGGVMLFVPSGTVIRILTSNNSAGTGVTHSGAVSINVFDAV